jgi:nitroreductase
MSIELVCAPWPVQPAPEATTHARINWYAAVARWAPSKHNTQPWQFIVRDDALDVWIDPARVLADTDPHRRELTISCGAAVQFACVAARGLGHELHVELLPSTDGRVLARLVERGPRPATDADRAELAAVAVRRTDRGPLDGEALPPDLPFVLQSAAAEQGAALRLVATPGDRASLARLVERADRLMAQRGDADRELQTWLRDNDDRRRDGVQAQHTRGAAASHRAEFVQRDFSTHASHPTHDRPGPDRPLVAVLCTTGDGPRDWLQAGRALGAVLLKAAAAGGNASYLNQPVEETAIRNEMRDQLTLPGPAQLVLRMGVGGTVPRTRRRSVAELSGPVGDDVPWLTLSRQAGTSRRR